MIPTFTSHTDQLSTNHRVTCSFEDYAFTQPEKVTLLSLTSSLPTRAQSNYRHH